MWNWRHELIAKGHLKDHASLHQYVLRENPIPPSLSEKHLEPYNYFHSLSHHFPMSMMLVVSLCVQIYKFAD